MKKILIFIACILLYSDSYAICIFGKGKDCKEDVRLIECYYEHPLTDNIQYIYKIVTVENACPIVHQVGYLNYGTLRGTVLKYDPGNEEVIVSYKTLYKNKGELSAFKSRQWPEVMEMLHKPISELK